MKSLKMLPIAVFVASALTACSSTHSPDYRAAHDRVSEVTEQDFNETTQGITPFRSKLLEVHSGINYHDINGYTLVNKDERRLPSDFNQAIFITDKDKRYTVDEFSAMLYSASGIVLDVSSPDLKRLSEEISGKDNARGARSNTRQQEAIASSAAVASDSTGDFDTQQVLTDLSQQDSAIDNREALKLKSFTFKGTAKEMLDYVSILNGLKWRYDPHAGKAFLYVKDTRSFPVYDFGSSKKLQNNINTTSKTESDSASGGSSMQYNRTQNVDPWKQIMDSIKDMIGDSDKVSGNQKDGLIMVTADDHTLSRVDSYVRKINEMTAKPITLQYRMVRVKYNESDFKGLNQNYLNNQLKNGMFGSFSMEAGLGSLSSNISGNTGTMATLAQGNYLALANDSFQALMGFLNSVGTAELAYETHVTVPNNEVYIHQGGKNQEYIASIQRSNFREGGGEENITTETGIAVDGVNLTLQPRIAGDQIIVQYSVANSDFISLDDAGLGNGLEGVKLKTDDSLYFNNTSWLKNGQTEVIKVISETAETTNSQGFVDKALWWLGGNETREKDKSVIIVTLTAFYNN